MILNAFYFFKRLCQFLFIGLRLLFKRSFPSPKKLRMFFEEMGGGFLKLGQILSLRNDILGDEYTFELFNLLKNIEEVPFEEMEKIFAEEKGAGFSYFFSEFDKKAIGSASIAQVYKARFKNLPQFKEAAGKTVIVKIQKPGIAEIFERDFSLIMFFASIIDFFRIFSSVSAQEVAAEFISWTRKELDFRLEAQNADCLYRHSVNHPRTVIPKQYLSFSTRRVLVQEYLGGGISVEDVILKKTEAGRLAERDINLEEMSYYLIEDMMRQYFIDGYFHADPHPANLMFLPGNKLAYIDFGIVGRASEHQLLFLEIFYAVANKDIDSLAAHFVKFGSRIISDDLEAYLKADIKKREGMEKIFEKITQLIQKELAAELKRILEPWFRILESSGKEDDYKEKSAVKPFFGIVRLAEKYGARMPKDIVLFFRVMSILDMEALRVCPAFDMIKAIRRFFNKYPLEEAKRMARTEAHSREVGKKIIPLTEIDWESFREIAFLEKERVLAARERIYDLITYYAERYDEVRSMIRKIK